MNNTTLLEIENKRLQALKKYELDEESIKRNISSIESTTEEQKTTKGSELYELIANKSYNEAKDLDKVKELILSGADVNFRNEKKGDYPLLVCARRGHLKTAILLIQYGADVNLTNNYLTTSTMAASRHGKKEILEILILCGADINVRCKDGDNALISAKKHNQKECFNLLVQANAHLNNRNDNNDSIHTINPTSTIKIPVIKEEVEEVPISSDDLTSLLEEATSKMMEINKEGLILRKTK